MIGISALAVELHPQAYNISFSDESLIIELVDGRIVAVSLVFFPKLTQSSKEQLDHWGLLGEGIHWPDIDEDLSVHGLLIGMRYIRMNSWKIGRQQ